MWLSPKLFWTLSLLWSPGISFTDPDYFQPVLVNSIRSYRMSVPMQANMIQTFSEWGQSNIKDFIHVYQVKINLLWINQNHNHSQNI